MLRNILEKVGQDAKDGSALDIYRTTLLRLGKAHRVETLMQGILKALQDLAVNQSFRTATQSQMAALKEAVDKLSNVESSVPDSDFVSPLTHNTQHVSAGGVGNQKQPLWLRQLEH